MWSNDRTSKSEGLIPGRITFGVPFLITVCTPMSVLIWYTAAHCDGSFFQLYQHFANSETNFFQTLWDLWPNPFDPVAVKIFTGFVLIQLAFMRLLPGETKEGPVTPAGNIPVYKANGDLTYWISKLGYIAALLTGVIPLGLVWDNLGNLFALCNLFSLVFVLFLTIKGRMAPCTSDSGSSGNFMFDYYWGTELYPRILGWDVKQFTNCRFGMIAWPMLLISYAAKQYELYGTIADSLWVSVLLQLIYCSKFFHWEMGYMRSIDIMHDRAGYYLIYGCMCWVPTLYTSTTMYLVLHPIQLGAAKAAFFFILGSLCIYINYDADNQRAKFRQNNGKLPVWGRKPEYIVAEYTTETGALGKSLLLCSGYWGISRHFHYVPEVLAAICWSVPSFQHIFPHCYWIFLTILLLDRSVRDDKRCQDKYGKHWAKYCERVPSRVIPGIF